MEVPGGVLYSAAFFHNGIIMKSNDYATVTDMQHEENNRHRSHLNLTIHGGVQVRDEGDYTCTVMDFYNNTNSATVDMKFVTGPNVDLNPMKSLITVDRGKKSSNFLIYYKAYPPASFYVYDPRNEQISSDMDVMNRNKYDVVIDLEKIQFRVKYPDLNDFGNYTIVATTVGVNFSTSVKLVVSGEMQKS